jgi:urease accessory protein
MEADTVRMRTTSRGLKPYAMTNLKTLAGVQEVLGFIETRGMLRTGVTAVPAP